MESYTLDLSLISLDRFFQLIRTKRMLPGRVMLREKMEDRFAVLAESGISSLEDLIGQLGSKQMMASFAARWELPYPYLVLLKREAGSYQVKPHALSNFPGIPFEYTEALRSKGIRNTRDFFQMAQTQKQRSEFTLKMGIPEARLLELYALCDLSRITGVGGTMARLCYEAGIRSVREFAETKVKRVLQLPEKDLRYCIGYARVIIECEMKSKSS